MSEQDSNTLAKRVRDLEQLTSVQASDGNWDWDDYMMGLANGLLLALHTMRGDTGEVPYKSKPDEWGCDRYKRLKAEGWNPDPVPSEVSS